MAYYSPEGFDVRDGDHDYPLSATCRTPRQAAKYTLVMKDRARCLIGLQTPDGEIRLPTDRPQPEVFTAYLRREKVFVYTPDMLDRK